MDRFVPCFQGFETGCATNLSCANVPSRVIAANLGCPVLHLAVVMGSCCALRAVPLVVPVPGVSLGPSFCCGPVIDQFAASGSTVRVLGQDQSGQSGATTTPFEEQDAATGVLDSGQ